MPYFVFDIFICWMFFICVIAGLITINLILIRNCSIFVSFKIYPAICNYSLFRKLDGKFKFTREVPSATNPKNVDNRNRYFKTKQNQNEENLELEILNKKESKMSSEQKIEILVNR
jgi:hypothetical protein